MKIKGLFYLCVFSMVILLGIVNGVKITSIAKAAEPNWITDEQTGCKIWNPHPKLKGSVTWSGECVDGKAHGYGILQWYQDGIKTLRHEFTATSGIIMENGFPRVTVDESLINFQIECEKAKKDRQGVQWYNSYRRVRGDVPKDIDLSHPVVVEKILSMAEQFAWQKCPARAPFSDKLDLTNVTVNLYQNNERVVWARSYPKMIGGITHEDMPVWGEFYNYILERRLAEAQSELKKVREEREKREREEVEETKRKEFEARKAREAKEKEEARKRLNEFIKKNGIEKWLTTEELAVNPFVYEGKTIAIVAEFEEMLSATEGIFAVNELFVVSGIPKGLFTSKAKVVLAGSVVGKTELKWKFMQMLVPHLKFVGVHFCKDWRCSDIFPD